MNDTTTVLAWLATKPDLASMRSTFPTEWTLVEREMASALAEHSAPKLDALLMRDSKPGAGLPRGRKRRREVVLRLVRQRMAVLALQRVGTDAMLTGTGTEAHGSFGRLTKAVTSGLFRTADGAKKPVSLRVFRMAWPLVREKAAFLAHAQSRGTYCFLSREFVEAVASIVGDRRCLEIAAGDGTLTRFLAGAGIQAVAVDDMSWSHEIRYPNFVRKMDAREALRTLAPEVVVCSWPPPGNPFEAAVFETPSVETYVVVGSRHAFATGAKDAYRSASGFSCELDGRLSRMVLPPEAGHEVLVFRRMHEGTGTTTLASVDTIP